MVATIGLDAEPLADRPASIGRRAVHVRAVVKERADGAKGRRHLVDAPLIVLLRVHLLLAVADAQHR